METRQPTEDARLISWTDCGHNSWRRGLVLDPFAGSGTTGGVAIGCGRDFLGCDIDKRNVDLARDRIGPMFFDELDLDAYTEEVNQAHTIKH
jgi:predicted RNA methylase